MARKVVDCRETPSLSNCTMTMMGEEEELVEAAVIHAKTVHGEEDSPELRRSIRESLRDEWSFLSGAVSAQAQSARSPAPH